MLPASRDLEEQWIRAIQESIAWRCVSIYSERKRVVGTGVPVMYRKRQYIVSTRHFLKDEDPNDLLFAGRPGGSIIRVRKRELSERMEAQPGTPAQELKRLHILDKRVSTYADDLAALRVCIARPQDRGMRFFPVGEAVSRTPRAGTTVMLSGFPGELARCRRGELRFSHDFELCTIEKARKNLSSFHSRRHFLLDFKVDRNSEEYVTHPEGMSGSGVWTLPPLTTGKVLEPQKVSLVGIQIAWYADSQLLKATKISRLICLLANS